MGRLFIYTLRPTELAFCKESRPMSTAPLSVVILAAGKGTRMRSSLPKVLHPVAHKAMVQHVIDTALALNGRQLCLVYGHGGEQMQQAIRTPLVWVEQAEQLGTGHAVAQALPQLADDDTVLILYGDVPLIREQTLRALLAAKPANGLALLTVTLANPTGYGRILRDAAGEVTGIVEEKDASAEQRLVREVNTGFMAANGGDLRRFLAALKNDNAQGEYYLTDVIAMARNAGLPIATTSVTDPLEVEGANNRAQLAALERGFQQRAAHELMMAGVTLRDPARFDLRGSLSCGQDVVIDTNVIIEGKVVLADGVTIGSGCLLKDCTIGAGTEVKAYSVVEGAAIGAGCSIGPLARLRPGTVLADDAHVGNFVEIKKASLGQGSKANHLTYLGDAEIGSGVNVGAGTITCNYDGANKHVTIIEDGAFIGSDSQLVAPVRIGKNATVGAGSTVTRDVGEGELVITRVKQRHIEGWQRPVKQK